ncbi:MAG: hypothetical protein KBT27_14350 [Prevotellaceae bacterium]|nr:hypothetical protein [Candidatus Faecinaster equi]
MGYIYKKKKTNEGDGNSTFNWYDYYRDKVLNKPTLEIETEKEEES